MSGTTAYKGRSAALQISSNGGSTFTTIGGIRVTNLTLNNNPVDITNMGSNGYQEMLPDGGTQSLAISGDGIFVDDTAFQTLQTTADDRTLIYYKLTFGGAAVVTCKMTVVSFGLGAPHDGAQTFNISLTSSGTITFTPDT